MECPPDTIVNFKTLGCVKDTTTNRRRLNYPQKPCPPDKPLRNPETMRCLKDTPKNRKALGLPQLKEPAKKTRRSKPVTEHAPRVRRQPNVRTSSRCALTWTWTLATKRLAMYVFAWSQLLNTANSLPRGPRSQSPGWSTENPLLRSE